MSKNAVETEGPQMTSQICVACWIRKATCTNVHAHAHAHTEQAILLLFHSKSDSWTRLSITLYVRRVLTAQYELYVYIHTRSFLASKRLNKIKTYPSQLLTVATCTDQWLWWLMYSKHSLLNAHTLTSRLHQKLYCDNAALFAWAARVSAETSRYLPSAIHVWPFCYRNYLTSMMEYVDGHWHSAVWGKTCRQGVPVRVVEQNYSSNHS